ncbi:MAG: energy-coupling factor transporter transmembrane protein EcfT [Lachnospiraceae bacterium]|nr:energy-coupling factor transporter transmembrane protein EcfT [Lachnospiraceae bacterium]MBQ7506131.1 energy-coupling factor transporter transmembrane protein EcfT [Lachnospiraceae bacterium]
MLKDITLGQYYPTDSVIHRLDPRVKLAAVLIFLITLFAFQGPVAMGVCAAFLIFVIVLTRIPFSFMIRGLRLILVILIITALMNLFFTNGEHILWSYGVLKISIEGIKMACLMVFRLIFLILGTSILTLTTTPNQLTEGMEKGLRWLSYIGVPIHEIAMMMSIALRFIPILTEETDKIMRAQMARGADFETGGLIKRAKAMIPLLVPLFVSAFRRANDLALAMEARCYHGGRGRTKLKPLIYQKRDFISYFVLLGYVTAVIAASVWWKSR